MLYLIRRFHASGPALMLTEHPLFKKLDWTRMDAGQYAVVDPVSTGSILYVSYQDYLVLVRVALSNNITLKVLAGPGDKEPKTPSGESPSSSDPNDQKSPPHLDKARVERELREFFIPVTHRRGRGKSSLFRAPLAQIFAKREQGGSGKMMVNLTHGNVSKWLTMWHDVLHWWSRSTVPGTITNLESKTFGLVLSHLLRHNGINNLITRFKISLFVVNAFLGGRKLTSTQELGFRIRLTNGLPAFLPLRVRSGIRNGNRHYIRIWTSVLNSYKGIEGEWKEPRLDRGSIAQPHPKLDTIDLLEFGRFSRWLWRAIKRTYKPRAISFHVQAPFFTTKAGPNCPNSLLGAGLDAYLWYSLDRVVKYDPSKDPESEANLAYYKHAAAGTAIRTLLGVDENLVRLWCQVTGQKLVERQIRWTSKAFVLQYQLTNVVRESWMDFLSKKKPQPEQNKASGRVKQYRSMLKTWRSARQYWKEFMGANNILLRFTTPTLSRLYNLYEPAGKVRTIAIVDYWTNFLLKPLHDWMFEILTCLPQDATFDQEGRVEEFSKRGYSDVYSYDLKSATDLIPLTLYKYVFGHIMPRGILEVWLRLLVDRGFLVPKSTLKAHKDHPIQVRYNTGQPMGALTSWASMALLHHFLVLYSAYRAGRVGLLNLLSFIDYLVLGDDIVIADERVAYAYVDLLRRLHIPIGLAKSHISSIGMFNFANQTFVGSTNYSPVSMREYVNAQGLLARLGLVMRMARRGWKDMGSTGWLSHILRGLTNSTIWRKTLAPIASVRGSVPILHWVIASALLPGTSRFGYTGLSVDPRLLLSTYVRKQRIWTTRLAELVKLSLTVQEQSLLSLFTARWVDSVYQQFLTSRVRLKEFDKWVTTVISVDLEWLFLRIFSEGRAQALEDWASKYRVKLKTIQVTTKLPAVRTAALLEHLTEMKLDELFSTIESAEKELPLIPDFSNNTLSAIFPKDEGGIPTHELRIKRAELQAMLRVASLVVMLEQIPSSDRPGQESGPSTTVGQSLESSLRTKGN